MGTDKRVSPDLFVKRTHFYDFLFNSDGLTDYVRDYEIQEELNQEGSIDDYGERLMQLAMSHDSKDNVSFILSAMEGDKV